MECNEQFHRLLDAVPVRLWCSDEAGNIHFNRAWRDFAVGDDARGTPIAQRFGIHPQDAAVMGSRFDHAIAAREPINLEFRLRRRDDVWRWMLCEGLPRTNAGIYAGFIGSCIDITDRHEAVAQQRRELDDKAAVMQELHHRVKNNAQVFASLLNVQGHRARDPAVKSALRVAAARASAMAITQQQIWDAGSSARFDLVALIRRLVHSHKSSQLNITIDAPATLFVPLATAVPLGLIVHELLVNARDHAFPDGNSGQVALTLARTGATDLTMTVADDGVGMPDPTHANPSFAGLTIVRSLVRQLGAELVTSAPPTGTGTVVRLTMVCAL